MGRGSGPATKVSGLRDENGQQAILGQNERKKAGQSLGFRAEYEE